MALDSLIASIGTCNWPYVLGKGYVVIIICFVFFLEFTVLFTKSVYHYD